MNQSSIKKLSIVIPVFNEEKTIERVVEAVLAVDVGCAKELIFVDDGSTDKTRQILHKFKDSHKVIFMDKNLGKGAAVRMGFKEATGDIVVIQDADLEYNPKEYPLLMKPILEGDADVVYGSRFISVFPRRVLYFHHYKANQLVTFISNVFTGLNLSDMETGYKMFTRQAVDKILPKLSSNRFGIEPELTARVAQAGFRIYETGISYRGRTYEDGKKITWKDGIAAIWHVIKFNLFKRG